MKQRGILWVGLLLIVGVLFSAGCSSKRVQPRHKPQLSVVQNEDGWVTFGVMKTRVGYGYAIMYIDQETGRWKPLKGCEEIKGTGGTVEIKKRFNPRVKLPPMTVDYVKIN